MSDNTLVKIMMIFGLGVVAGMMYAPKKGEQFREDVVNTAKNAVQKLGKIKNEECEMIEDTAKLVKSKAKNVSNIIEK